MKAVRLLALDIDGTLLTDQGEIAAEDRHALARARAAGLEVTLATGRLPSEALPIAEELAITLPIVCCDGAVTVCPRTQVDLHTASLGVGGVESALASFARHGLTAFLFTSKGLVAAAASEDAAFVGGWSSAIVVARDLAAFARGPGGDHVITVLGVAPPQSARAAHDELAGTGISGVELSVFPLDQTDRSAVRLHAAGVDKGTGVASVADSLDIASDEVAAVGDWYNDVPLFGWAGHSFAMGHAPSMVAEAARHRLRATAATGGGIAEALAWLESLRSR